MRSIREPSSYAPLAHFSCGGNSDYEVDADKAIKELLDLSDEECEEFEIRVAESPDSHALIGVTIFHERALGPFSPAICLALLAVGEPFRGWRMPDGATRVGTFLLCDALAQTKQIWGESMPVVWGNVHQDNGHCRRLLSSHRFWRLRGSSRDPSNPYYTHMRDAGVTWSHGFTQPAIEAVKEAREQQA